jgi:hypothetical protein
MAQIHVASLGGPHAPSPTRRRPRLRVSCSPSPQPSPQGPQGEGEIFVRPLTMSWGHRSERQGSGDYKRNARIFQHRAEGLPLLGERAGVRGNEANSSPRRTRLPGAVQLRESPAEREVSTDYEKNWSTAFDHRSGHSDDRWLAFHVNHTNALGSGAPTRPARADRFASVSFKPRN